MSEHGEDLLGTAGQSCLLLRTQPTERGQGETYAGPQDLLRGILTRTALLTSVAEGHRIVAVCPYVAHWLPGHDDVEESVDTVRSVHLEAVRRASAEADVADS